MTRFALWLALASAALAAGPPASWVPARWDGGPVEVARRAGDKALSNAAVRDAIDGWYDPATLGLLDGAPVNCLLLTLSAGLDARIETRQLQLVKEYARRAHERGMAALGIVYPGAAADAVVSSVRDAQLEGVVLDGEFPGGLEFARGLDRRLRAAKSAALVIPIASAQLLRESAWPVFAVEGDPPEVGKADGPAVASPTAAVWIDSNMWRARSMHPGPGAPVWIGHGLGEGSPGIEARSIADAAAAGARWIVALDDQRRAALLHREAGAIAEWHSLMSDLAWYEGRAGWNAFAASGNVGIVLDTAAGAADSEEYLNLVARRQIAYRVIYRRELSAAALEGLRAVLAFGFDPPTETERKLLSAFAASGGTLLTGPSWGGAPKDQSYTILAEGEGEIAVYKDGSPDPDAVARDLEDLVPTPELGVSVFNAPSTLSYVSADADGKRMLIRLVNYATRPTGSILFWIPGQFRSARLESPGQPPLDLPVKRSGARTEITIPALGVFGALLVE